MAEQSSHSGKVFVSYSHRDGVWLERLRVHLKSLERAGVLEVWDDTLIETGENWRQQIQVAIEAASVAVLLVSKDSLASDFITEAELPPLLEAHKNGKLKILPLILNPCRFEQTPRLGQLQAVNSPQRTLSEMPEVEQDRVFLNLAEQIHVALTKPLRDRLRKLLGEVEREFQTKYGELENDARLKEREKEFLKGMWQVAELDKKRGLVLEEVVACDSQTAQAASSGEAANKGAHELQRGFLMEELQRLNRERETVMARVRAGRDEEQKELSKLFGLPGFPAEPFK
jgi:hypothetical protein